MSDLAPGGDPAPTSFDPRAAPSAAKVFGSAGAAAHATVELLTHNPLNAVTGGIWRVRHDDRSAIAKLLTDGREHTGPAGWAASRDKSHWNWWEREARVYGAAIPDRYAPDGVGAPRLLGLDRLDDGGSILLWLEDVDGALPDTTAALAHVAERLGRAQGRLAREPIPAWLSHGFLAGYAESKDVDARVFDDDAAWAHPLVATHLGPLRDDLRALHQDRHRFYAVVARCPRTLCHLDCWPANILLRPDGRAVLLDWAFTGDGAIGEDIGNLVPDSAFDLLMPIADLSALAEHVVDCYLAGLDASGWTGDPRLVTLAIQASAAKYHWLAERLVRFADRDRQVVYGGREVEPDELYAARAEGLALLCRWAAHARRTARSLGWWT